ncbi:Acetyltransferase (GNAT) family protein [Quadrisphaera granulorum]|uniref:Acetyltransferase (GNAT) family protein n=1 Tax=Quadrisphaera granulorum TaxID=317664 RepID=A0A316A6U3_9ACTN|nr:GNAT family N-acetyltransferase [Quadrisphaera granulorum]PWJ53656.1 acetyltransferase (GNAT) family protein [Quadrisphaera granulorum]SZE96700.1 Acetyltransferase (GNAT) family protein [Quadrisphaera granulorum]
MTTPVTVDEPTDADASALGAMHLRSWHETYDEAPGIGAAWVDEHIGFITSPPADAFRVRTFAAQRADPSRTYYRVARRGEVVVGFVHASLPSQDQDDDGDAKLEALYVLRSEHGTGLADRLMTSALAWADGRAVWLEASPLSVRAVPFYRRHGFEPTGETGVFRHRVLTVTLRRPADA